jgi:hypothetical protein
MKRGSGYGEGGGKSHDDPHLRLWELVKLHPDVEAGAMTEAVFAIDLGAIAAGDPNVPVVNPTPSWPGTTRTGSRQAAT